MRRAFEAVEDVPLAVFNYFKGLIVFVTAGFTFHNSKGLSLFIRMHNRANFMPIN